MTDETLPSARSRLRRARVAFAAAGLLVVGGIAGGIASHAIRPAIEMAPLKPVTIASLPKAEGIVTIKGRVAETYGNKFVIDDGTARTLVDTGREGDERKLVSDGGAVTVQGRFERGFVHASFLVDPAGTVTALAPMHGPRGGDHEGHRGPGRHDDDRRDGPPPAPVGDAPQPGGPEG